MRPWQSVPPVGSAAHGLPGSHGPSDGSTMTSNGERTVNRTALNRRGYRPFLGAARGVIAIVDIWQSPTCRHVEPLAIADLLGLRIRAASWQPRNATRPSGKA